MIVHYSIVVSYSSQPFLGEIPRSKMNKSYDKNKPDSSRRTVLIITIPSSIFHVILLSALNCPGIDCPIVTYSYLKRKDGVK